MPGFAVSASNMLRIRPCILLAILSVAPVWAQSKKKFDVASIKPNRETDNRFMLRNLPGGSFTAAGVTLKMLIMNAYGVQAFQISGGPGWIGTDRWDIQAKAEGVDGRVPREQFEQMLRALLEDRFQLKVRRESKEMPVYALVMAKNGPKLAEHAGDPPKPGEAVRIGYGSLQYEKARVAALAFQLSVQSGRTVIDKTELAGEYDFALRWTPDPEEGGPESIGLPPDPNRKIPPVDPNLPSIFTALQQQLGLRLESQKGPVDILVIDRVEKPTEN